MSISKHIINKHYLGGCLINDCLPMTYDDNNIAIYKKIGVISACFI